MSDDARRPGRVVRGLAWAAALAGAAIWVLAAQGIAGFSEARGQGWLGTSEGIAGAMPWLVAMFVATGTTVGLTVVHAAGRATVRTSIAGIAITAVQLTTAVIAAAWDFPEAGLAHLGYLFAVVLVMIHGGASLIGFGLAWDALRPIEIRPH